MVEVIRRLWLGVCLILLAAAILLWSDVPRRAPLTAGVRTENTSAPSPRLIRVALLQMVSQPIIDDGALGVIAGLKESGFADSDTFALKRFNAEGDLATVNAMAQELTGGGYDLVITLTTGALQAVANANQQRHIPHVFGLVTDPTKAGVGVGADPLDHPAHMVGIGTLQPVAESLRMARQLNPHVKRIGIAWNPAEVNSEICTKLAREACRELEIELVEATVENSAAVNEAIASLISRDVDMLWIGGDVTVLSAFDLVAKAAKAAQIPVCTCMPGNAAKGALFDYGANYYEVGIGIGRLAGQVLHGEPIARLPVTKLIPPKVFVNTLAIPGLRPGWSISPEFLQKADAVIDAKGLHQRPGSAPQPSAGGPSRPSSGQPSHSATPTQTTAQPLARKWKLRLIEYVNSPDVEEAESGLRAGMKSAGLVDGRDFELKVANAQGDMTVLHGMVDAALSDQADLLLTISTQALQSAIPRARGTPVVFTMVANPFAAGVAKSDMDHLPGFTGSYGANDTAAMMPILKQVMPKAHRIGAMYAPNEVNSVYSFELLVAATKPSGYELISMGVNSPTEAPDVTQALCGQNIDLICLPNSNLASSSFPTIIQSARKAKVPVFGFFGSMAKQGAVLALTRDYHDMGHDAGLIAARVMRGEQTAHIPLHQSRKNRLLINRTAARSAGLEIPASLLQSATQVLD